MTQNRTRVCVRSRAYLHWCVGMTEWKLLQHLYYSFDVPPMRVCINFPWTQCCTVCLSDVPLRRTRAVQWRRRCMSSGRRASHLFHTTSSTTSSIRSGESWRVRKCGRAQGSSILPIFLRYYSFYIPDPKCLLHTWFHTSS